MVSPLQGDMLSVQRLSEESRHGLQLLTESLPHLSPADAELERMQELIEAQNAAIAAITRRMETHTNEVSIAVQAQMQKMDLKLSGLADLMMLNTGTPHFCGGGQLKKKMRAGASGVQPPVATPLTCNIVDDNQNRDKEHDTELEHSRKIIADLRAQAAARAAVDARRDELQKGGRLLRSLRVPSGARACDFQIGDIFTQYSGTAQELLVSEPYLVASWQLENLETLFDGLLRFSHVRNVALSTHSRSEVNRNQLDDLVKKYSAMNLVISVAYVQDLHLRELVYSNGIVISSDRGLDLFQAPSHTGLRCCRNSTVHYFEQDAAAIASSANIAATLAAEAKQSLQDQVTKDVNQIKALLQTDAASPPAGAALEDLRHQVENMQVADVVTSLGYAFLEDFDSFTLKDFCSELRRCQNGDIVKMLEGAPRLLEELLEYRMVTKLSQSDDDFLC